MTARDGEPEKTRARAGMWQAMVRGPIVHDESGRRRALSRPGGLEFVIALILTAAAMIALYGGLDGRNARLLASGASFFSPRLSFDDDIALVPVFVVAYYSYFPLLFFFSVITGRDRRLMYEGVIGYVGIAIIGFLFFWLLPSRMVQPDISACTTAWCRSLDAMYRLDEGFNIFPSMHVGYSTLVWLFFRRYMPELSRAVGALVLAIVLSTLLCKRHYIVDIPAAVAMAVVVFAASQRYGAALTRLMRFAGPALVLVGAALSPRIARAGDPEPSFPPIAQTPSRFSQATQGAIITKPEGAYLRHDVRYRLGDSGVRVGLFDSFLSVSNEIGSSIGYATVPEWLALQAEIAAEPGFYLRSPVAESRTADVRTVARVQANLNLRVSRFWLYGRTTAGLRLRNFDEHDSFRELVLRRELWVEQATALLVRVNDDPASAGSPSFWAYGEYTVGRVTSTGSPAATTAVTMPNRVSGGVISEDFLAKGLFLDLDLFWSVAPPPTDGFGVIAALWIAWP